METESIQTELLYHVVDAGHLRNIGEQSISNHVQAILELVKNAYDGDAEHCTVTFHGTRFFNHPLKIEKITIEDDSKEMYDLFTNHMIKNRDQTLKLFGLEGWGIEKADFSAPYKVTATIFNHNIQCVKFKFIQSKEIIV